MTKRFLIIAVAILAMVTLWYVYNIKSKDNEIGAIKLLPKSASEVKTHYWNDGWHGDHIILVKARLPFDDYRNYVTALKMPVQFNANTHKDIIGELSCDGSKNFDWWNPPKPSDTTYLEYNKRFKDIVMYNNGYVYYYSVSW
jgi:hypothetical protein